MSTMGEPILFKEVQRPRQWWVWALVWGIAGLTYVMAFLQLALGMPLGNNPATDLEMAIILFFVGVAFPAFMLSIRMTVEVRGNGLFLRFTPFHHRFVDLNLRQAVAIQARTYSPLREFGGWGIRYGRGGTAYNMNGNRGVELTFPRDRHILIGTDRPEELESALRLVWRPSRE